MRSRSHGLPGDDTPRRIARTMPVYVRTTRVRASPIRTPALALAAERMLGALALPRAELSILLCDDSTIHELNREHRHKDKPTDVLAFAMREGETGHMAGDVLGDVVISIDTARRQAEEHARSASDEIRFLLAHGILHLVGYDHPTRAEERRMMAMTDVLLAAARSQQPVRDPKRIRR